MAFLGFSQRCQNCHKPYCSDACQKKDWPVHKKHCQALKAVLAYKDPEKRSQIFRRNVRKFPKYTDLERVLYWFKENVSDISRLAEFAITTYADRSQHDIGEVTAYQRAVDENGETIREWKARIAERAILIDELRKKERTSNRKKKGAATRAYKTTVAAQKADQEAVKQGVAEHESNLRLMDKRKALQQRRIIAGEKLQQRLADVHERALVLERYVRLLRAADGAAAAAADGAAAAAAAGAAQHGWRQRSFKRLQLAVKLAQTRFAPEQNPANKLTWRALIDENRPRFAVGDWVELTPAAAGVRMLARVVNWFPISTGYLDAFQDWAVYRLLLQNGSLNHGSDAETQLRDGTFLRNKEAAARGLTEEKFKEAFMSNFQSGAEAEAEQASVRAVIAEDERARREAGLAAGGGGGGGGGAAAGAGDRHCRLCNIAMTNYDLCDTCASASAGVGGGAAAQLPAAQPTPPGDALSIEQDALQRLSVATDLIF